MSKIKRRKPKHSDNQTSSKSAPDINMRSEPETQMPDLTNFTSQTLSAGQVLHLQRTIGNQAVQRLIKSKGVSHPAIRRKTQAPMVQRFSVDDGDWDSVTDAKATAGQTGVFFMSDGNSELVVKGLGEAPQRSMFAGSLMEEVAGIETANTRPVATNSVEGQQILNKIGEIIAMRQQTNDKSQLFYGDNAGDHARFFAKLQEAPTLLVMEKMQVFDFANLEKAEQGGVDLSAMFNSENFWKKLGKMYAVDQFLGNEDRLESLKVQNLFIDPMGELVALDNDAMFFDALTEWQTEQGSKPISRDKWVEVVTGGGYMTQTGEQANLSANLEAIGGSFAELDAKVQAKAIHFLTFLKEEGAAQTSAQTQQTLSNLNVGIIGSYMMDGAFEARTKLMKMMKDMPDGQKSQMQIKFEKYSNDFSQAFGNDILYTPFGLQAKVDYLDLREQGSSPDEAREAMKLRYAAQLPRHGDFADELDKYYRKLRALPLLDGEDQLRGGDIAPLYDDIKAQQGNNDIKTAYLRGVDSLTQFKLGQYQNIVLNPANRYLHKNLAAAQIPWEPASLIAMLTNWIGQVEGKSERTSRFRGNRQGNLQSAITIFDTIRNKAQEVAPIYQEAKNKN